MDYWKKGQPDAHHGDQDCPGNGTESGHGAS
jgi:hypothetical protein